MVDNERSISVVYNINQGLVNQIQQAHDLNTLKTASLVVMDSLLGDIINNDARRENGDKALEKHANGLASRVEQLEYQVAELTKVVRQLGG